MRPANKRRLRKNRKARIRAGGSSKKPTYARKKRAAGAQRRRRAPGLALSSRVKNYGGQLSFSGAKHYHRPDVQVRTMERIGAVNQVVNQFQYTLTAAEGTQANFAFGMFDSDQLRALLANVAGPAPRRVVAEGLTNEYTFSNYTNAPMELEIYDIVCKRDVYRSYDFTTAIDTYIPAPNPASYWNQGLNAQSGVATTATASAVIGSQPTDSQLFKDWFKIVKRTCVMLPQSGAHRHLVSIKTNRIIDTMLAGNPEGVACLREYTKFVMVNIKGLPVWHTTPVAVTTIGSTQLGVVAVQRLKYTWVADYQYNASLNQTLNAGTAVNSIIWNQGSGAITPLTGLASLP